jgi:hypothetical protein
MAFGVDETPCSVTGPEGDCLEPIWIAKPIPLCRPHALQVAEVVVPDLIAESLRALRTRQSPKTLAPEEASALIDGSRALDPRDYLDGAHGPIVYVIENGSRVKIGYTTCLRRRITDLSLRDCNILLLLEGGPTLERALHHRFAPFRVERTEWFALTDTIVAFIESKRAQLADRPAMATLAELVAQYAPEPAGDEPASEPEPQPEPVQMEIESEPEPPVPARVAPRYPDGSEIDVKDEELWQLLGEYGREGAPVGRIAARAKALGHRFNSPPWVRSQMQWWVEKSYVDCRTTGRETVFWRRDLRSEVIRDGQAAS